MFNASSMCNLEKNLQVQTYTASMRASILAWVFFYTRPIYKLYTHGNLSPYDLSVITQLLFEVARFILLPMFYAYLWRPTPRITIQVACTDRETMTDDLDTIDKSILHTLSRNPSGCTARMIHQRIGPMYPELERSDITERLDALTTLNRAAVIPTNLSSMMWVPIKVKAQ